MDAFHETEAGSLGCRIIVLVFICDSQRQSHPHLLVQGTVLLEPKQKVYGSLNWWERIDKGLSEGPQNVSRSMEIQETVWVSHVSENYRSCDSVSKEHPHAEWFMARETWGVSIQFGDSNAPVDRKTVQDHVAFAMWSLPIPRSGLTF